MRSKKDCVRIQEETPEKLVSGEETQASKSEIEGERNAPLKLLIIPLKCWFSDSRAPEAFKCGGRKQMCVEETARS